MSLPDGTAAVNLEIPARIPRVEFDAETHWELVSKVIEIHVHLESPDEVKMNAIRAFIQTWNYDIKLESLINEFELNARHSSMGHAEYAAGGIDYDDNTYCPFKTPEDVFASDPWETYGKKDKSELIRRFNEHY
jgi:hypothetical protein